MLFTDEKGSIDAAKVSERGSGCLAENHGIVHAVLLGSPALNTSERASWEESLHKPAQR
jgi:hypothetical protein